MLENENLNHQAINSIADLANQVKGADGKIAIVPIPGHPQGKYLIVQPDGKHEAECMPLPPRATTLKSVDQVPGYVIYAIDNWDAHPAVYYDTSGMQIVLDEDDITPKKSGGAVVKFEMSEQFKMLMGFSKDRDAAWRSHKAFMLMLRIDLETCLEPFALEQTIRACEAYTVDDTSQVRSTVMRTRESLGKDVQAELRSGAGEIPSTLVMKVRVFKDPALLQRRQIVCKLETDPTNGGKFAILPLAEEIENAIDQEMAELGETLRSSIGGSMRRLEDPNADPDAPQKLEALPTFVPVFYGKF